MKRLFYSFILAAAVAVPAQAQSPGGTLAKMGVTTVALDEHGDLMRYHPDGTRTPLT